jgi:hypothetical protein
MVVFMVHLSQGKHNRLRETNMQPNTSGIPSVTPEPNEAPEVPTTSAQVSAVPASGVPTPATNETTEMPSGTLSEAQASQTPTMQHAVTISPVSAPQPVPAVPAEPLTTAPSPSTPVDSVTPDVSPQVFGQAPVAQEVEGVAAAAPHVSTFDAEPTSGKAQVFGKDGGKKGFTRKKLLIVSGSTLAVLLLAAGAVFGLYLPNTPGNVYNTGVERSGDALNTLVASATAVDKLKSYTTSNIQGSVSAKVEGSEYSGDFTTSFDKISSDSGVNIAFKADGGQTQKLTVKSLTQLPESSLYPDVYLQITGLKALGLDAFVPGVSDYDGKWIYASSDYLKSLGGDYGITAGDNTKSEVTASDIASLVRAGWKETQDYVFTTDKDKAVLQQTSFVGKEEVDGIKTYHYKMKLNAAHVKDYCVALTSAVTATDAYKKLSGQSDSEIADAKKEASKSCDDTAKDITKDNDSFDMWVDAKYKLIHKYRFTDPDNKQAYFDVGQNYTGGDKISLFVNYVDGKAKTKGAFTLDTDVKADTTAATLEVTNSSDDSFKITAKLNATVSDKAVKITKPTANIVTVQDILKKFGLNPTTGEEDVSAASPSVQIKAKDSERKTDISALDSHLEAYFADKGVYPTLVNVNSTTWRATNMKGLDTAALKDPDGTAATLAAQATKTQYGYVPSKCTSDGCESFVVSAILSDGTVYEKASF